MEKIKEKKWFIVAVAVLFLIIAMALALKNNATDINGKWVVEGYNINGQTILKKDIATYMGVIFAQYNDFQISFTKAGNVELIKPNLSPTGTAKSTTYKLKYTITGNTIEIYDKDDFMLMTLNGKQILCTIDGIELILQKN